MPKFYIHSGNVEFVVSANDAEGAAMWVMHRVIDDKICFYEDEANAPARMMEDALLWDKPIDGVPANVPFEPMLEGLAEFDETIRISERGFGYDDAGEMQTDDVFRHWRQLMSAVDRLFDQMG